MLLSESFRWCLVCRREGKIGVWGGKGRWGRRRFESGGKEGRIALWTMAWMEGAWREEERERREGNKEKRRKGNSKEK